MNTESEQEASETTMMDMEIRPRQVDIVYNRDSASRSVAWLGSSHKTGAANNASLFPRLARAAPACPGLTQRAS